MKSRWLRTVKNHCKAGKIHSSGDMQLGHRIGKVRKTDECVEICRKRRIEIRMRTLVSGVYVSLAGGFMYFL